MKTEFEKLISRLDKDDRDKVVSLMYDIKNYLYDKIYDGLMDLLSQAWEFEDVIEGYDSDYCLVEVDEESMRRLAHPIEQIAAELAKSYVSDYDYRWRWKGDKKWGS